MDANSFYSGLSDFGRGASLIYAILGTFISIILFAIGVYLLFYKVKFSSKYTIQGVITDSRCYENHVRHQGMVKYCDISYSYSVQNVKTNTYSIYTGTGTVQVNNETRYAPGNPITVYYNPKNISESSLSIDAEHYIGWILIGVSVLLVILSWVSYYLARKYKAVAAIEGVGFGLDMLRHY